MPAPKNNQNAAKPEAERRSGYVLRVPLTPGEREKIEAKAEAKGLKLAEYARLRILR